MCGEPWIGTHICKTQHCVPTVYKGKGETVVPDDATPQSDEMLALRAEVARMRWELAEAKKPRDTKAQTAKEVVQALDAAGVTQTSNGQSVVQNSNPNEETRLKLLAEYRTFAGKGIDNPQYRNFAERLSKMGVTTGDLYRTWS